MKPNSVFALSLPDELRDHVEAAVASGRFADAEEVVAAALRAQRDAGTAATPPGSAPASTASPLELRYRAILQSALDHAIIAFDAQGRIVEWNCGAQAITGWSEAEMLGGDGHAIFTPEDRAAGIPQRDRECADAEGRALAERWHMRADGSRFWGSGLMMPIRDAGGASIGHLRIMQDRTEAHGAGQALAASEARLQAVFTAVPVGILVAEAPSGRLVASNAQLDRVFGRHWPRSSQVSEYGSWECFHPDGRRLLAEEYPLARVLAGEERPVVEALRRNDADERRWLRLTGSAIRAPDGRLIGAVVTAEDIDAAKGAEALLRADNADLAGQVAVAATDLRDSRSALVGAESRREEAEGQVRQLQKMEAVGQLTGGIAHDFNNMLAVVISGLSLMQRRLARGDTDIGRFIDAAMDGARRAAILTQRLLAFSRQQALAPVSLDVNAMVQGMEELLRRTLGEAIELEMVLAGGLWRTHADPNQLENALLNLVVNARDAMAGAGRLTVETANAHLDDEYARRHDEVTAGQYVQLSVSDTGTGMTPEVIARAFEPFYTTKAPGIGTGLGLSQVYGFVKQSGGHLKIYSEPGQGTTMKVYVPRYTGQQESVVMPPLVAEIVPGRADEVVLIVEDEDRVREIAVAALREVGYSVVHASNAADALRRIDALPGLVLLFTDIVMPGMNGRRLADEARRRRPDLKILFTTGYTRNAVVHNGMLDPGVDLIGKPYTIEQLAAKVRDVLDRPPVG